MFVKGSSLADVHMPSMAELQHLRWSPIVLASLYETRFLIDPNPSSALELLQVYAGKQMIFTAFTPHWTYRAAVVINSPTSQTLASTILERCKVKWPNSEALQEVLKELAQTEQSA